MYNPQALGYYRHKEHRSRSFRRGKDTEKKHHAKCQTFIKTRHQYIWHQKIHHLQQFMIFLAIKPPFRSHPWWVFPGLGTCLLMPPTVAMICAAQSGVSCSETLDMDGWLRYVYIIYVYPIWYVYAIYVYNTCMLYMYSNTYIYIYVYIYTCVYIYRGLGWNITIYDRKINCKWMGFNSFVRSEKCYTLLIRTY